MQAPHPLIGSFPEVFDSSMLACFKTCPQLFYKIYVNHWKTRGEKIDLHAGKSFAHGLEIARRAYYEQSRIPQDSYALGLQGMSTAYGDFECPSDNPKSHDRVLSALAYYFDHYPFNNANAFPILLPGGGRAIETSFVHPIDVLHPVTGNPILYCGRTDAVISWAGDTYICDEKTTKSLGGSWGGQWDMRSQFIGYTWGFRKEGFRIAGVVVRGISILKTKHETVEHVCNFSPWEVDRWYTELCEWIEDAKLCWERKRWKFNLDHSCSNYGGCGFKDVCKKEDESQWLKQFFEQRYWNPVTREEILLA